MKIDLFNEKKQCCGCGACVNICPKNAITLSADENGFLYPVINEELCVGCGACKNVCAYQYKNENKGAQKVYAAARKDVNKIKKSTSGGIFAVFAEEIIRQGGIVYGSVMDYVDGKLVIRHKGAECLEELLKMQGSKYVQSYLGDIYKDVKEKVISGRKVLFSGTPCQVAALKGYLKKEYDNLLTIDIICHGVPSQKFFQEHIEMLEERYGEKIKEYCFRDKENGWGLKAKIIGVDCAGNENVHKLLPTELSYYSLFLDGYIYRENCYSCKYTNEYRPADVTIGDYWGIGDLHPNFMSDNGGKLIQKQGVSTVIVNNDKGKVWLEQVKNEFYMYESTFGNVASRNPQLRQPCEYPKQRNKILNLYRKRGYEEVDKYAIFLNKTKICKRKIKDLVKKIILKKLC